MNNKQIESQIGRLYTQAEVEQRIGNSKKAQKLIKEALKLAKKLK